MIQALPPLSLYVHIPWCVKKCPYCDFNSHTTKEVPEKAYLEQLKKDLLADLIFVQERPLKSIFFGGGTPSIMSPEFYQELLDFIRQHIEINTSTEITLEANPGTTEASKFLGYRQAGINRLSIGVQSFQSHQLEKLGRIHSGDDALIAVEQAKKAGFDNFNLDLMHGLPEQTIETALADLQQALDLNPTHLSWYQLTIEQNTEFFNHPPVLPEDESLWEIQLAGVELLKQHNRQQYEVSAFALPGREAQHNLNYWHFGDYLGIGAGAHGKVSFLEGFNKSKDILTELGVLRYRKTRMPKDYLAAHYNLQPKASFRIGEEVIKIEDLPFEFLMNTLRLSKGVEESLFKERTGLDISALEPSLSNLRKQGLLKENGLCPTDQGHLFLNDVLARFT
ncbi:MAG: putative oxygen-independent coproporphyrinogen III oxidase [Oleiphilaceae bacterium]|jgi:oxygen-independent coproporphyrinogen-3 oxidase